MKQPCDDPDTYSGVNQPAMQRPELVFTEAGSPHCARFDDVYFSTDDGYLETDFVFLQGNDLAQRFARLTEYGHFTVAETGFGTGLSALATWELFEQTAPATARLTFISTERYPLSTLHIQQALQAWPLLTERVNRLVADYPPRVPGFHLVELSDQVDLLLLFGDVNDTLAELSGQVDAWFLDGFTPSRNPAMWQPPLYQSMARLSHADTTFATFTSASQVQAGLRGAGFAITRKPGFGKKRQMLLGQFEGLQGPPRPGLWPQNEWFWPGACIRDDKRTAIVIGAGLAGAHTARELARRGWEVTVLEQSAEVASGASGNLQGAVYARLSHDDTPVNRFYTQALHLAQRRLAALPDSVPHQQCGLLQLNQGNKEARRFNRLRQHNPFAGELADIVDQEQTMAHAGVPLPCEGLFFPGGGWVQPVALVKDRLTHPFIQVHRHHRATDLKQLDNGHWQVQCETAEGERTLVASQVILCNAWNAHRLTQSHYLPLKPIGGQVTRIESTPTLAGLKAVICSDRYLVPAFDGAHSLGASFHVGQTEPGWTDQDDVDNLNNARQRLPDLLPGDEKIRDARAGQRCASPDYFPQAGPLVDVDSFVHLYQTGLTKRLTARLPAPPFHSGLWVNLAHGSKGLCSIPLASRTLAAWITGEPLPIAQSVANHLNPNRFIIRQLIRGQR
ncbi:bifunctional tRNA (5-methylaminomethyl-2-thiouridine)(34)-methyltransferase MnmD/FAD-dependent 5-carboxymethylaminomethyl-2-thiouridine(34) oxidoreductase MnmC [Saccharospirillum impatiens]|uniref:bifunctional tRNA (5-methylaminomethyl-2-thiouridine)(34)-methyltransferase MnmD/FAD-dependent 5-carboxymethylaminomethyl-2-thiouridine(34) oxidoreductase MnmC n=1 Tax=Saccharospirillum impatiens TaxID=169438 RepID=UPI00040938E4|nr:bifunctional tRNA (5-methylaminomethyl-2-thiouridine)(34)-methyltransferase MnmD/FAD-dependent 5-carboxymethylaminomethyl-2-thiouridine(34) oxidoreductase MnmC [Saccharospirillum impatiens]